MSATSLIGFTLLAICLCVGTIVLSFNYKLAETLVYHLDMTDALFGVLFLIFVFARS